jgi:predicted metal-dependent HD superfamily phosphohydrolase
MSETEVTSDTIITARSIFEKDWISFALNQRVGDHVFDEIIVPMYEGRAYHNLKHVLKCREAITDLSERLSLGTVMLAIWFHDIIYDPLESDNEEKSAGIARVCLIAGHTGCTTDNHKLVDGVVRLILATDHQDKPESGDEQIIADVDMSILGALPHEYDDYRMGIAAEFARTNVPPRDFVRGRVDFLERYLTATIFYTDYFHHKFNDRANENIRSELHKLYTLLDPESGRACQYCELISSLDD